MTIELTVLISVATAIVGALLGISGFVRNSRKDHSEEIKERTILLTKLDNINHGVQDIKERVNTTVRRLDEMNETTTRIDESTKSAHKQIDKLEKRLKRKDVEYGRSFNVCENSCTDRRWIYGND